MKDGEATEWKEKKRYGGTGGEIVTVQFYYDRRGENCNCINVQFGGILWCF
jgi:hypothetical protein